MPTWGDYRVTSTKRTIQGTSVPSNTMLNKKPIRSEVNWDYGDGVVKNPVIERDRKLLNQMCNPANCFEPDTISRASVAETESMYTTSSAESATLASMDSSVQMAPTEVERAEAEALTENFLKWCRTEVLGDDASIDSQSDATRANESYILSIERKPTVENSVRKSRSLEVALKSDSIDNCSSRSRRRVDDSMVGRSVNILERSLLDGCSFDTDEGMLLDGEKRDGARMLRAMLSPSHSGSALLESLSHRTESGLEAQESSSIIHDERRDTIRHVTLSESSDSSHASIDFFNNLVNDASEVGTKEETHVTREKRLSQESHNHHGQESVPIQERGDASTKWKSWFSSRNQDHSTLSRMKRHIKKKSQKASSVVRSLRSSCKLMFKAITKRTTDSQTQA